MSFKLASNPQTYSKRRRRGRVIMKKLLVTFFLPLFPVIAFACSPGVGGGPSGDPHCMAPILANDPYYNGSMNRQQPQQAKTVTVQVPSKFGALAYSSRAGYITGSLNHNSKAEAQQAAIQRCQQGSKTPCKAIAWVRNGCVAAAEGKIKNKFVVVDGAGHPGTAEQIALQNCRKGGLTECKILAPEGCSLP